MKKLTIAAALLSLSIAAPAVACPEHSKEATPRTAEQANDARSAKDGQGKATAKAGKAKTDKAKPAKTAEAATPDKVSQK